MTDRTPCIFCGQQPKAFHVDNEGATYWICVNPHPLYHGVTSEIAATEAEAGRLWDRLMRLGRVRR